MSVREHGGLKFARTFFEVPRFSKGFPSAANLHGLGPLLAATGIQADPDHDIQMKTSLQLAALQDEVLSLFESAGISPLVLKGQPLSERIYGNAFLRPSGDVDVAVMPREWERAREVLRTAGFRESGRRDHFHQALVHAKLPGTIELHRDLSDGRFQWDLQDIFSRTHEENLSGRVIRVMEPGDELLYLAHHLAVHGRGAKLLWLVDILAALAVFGDGIAWGKITERMAVQGISRSVSVGLLLAIEFGGKHLPAPFIEGFRNFLRETWAHRRRWSILRFYSLESSVCRSGSGLLNRILGLWLIETPAGRRYALRRLILGRSGG